MYDSEYCEKNILNFKDFHNNKVRIVLNKFVDNGTFIL